MINVKVKLFGTLRRYHPGEQTHQELNLKYPEGTTLKKILDDLNVPDTEVKMIFVNNLKVKEDYQLQEGDEIGIFPPIAGG